jgi:mannose-6-phosphate isomerase-like protein (cupin superfamily)
MQPGIHLYRPEREFFISEGCFITELSAAPADEECSIARARVAPGVTTRWHLLRGVSERYVILEGRGSMEVGELTPTDVGPGDVVLIPPDCRQRITNVGECDLVFLCVCMPQFTAQCYEEC